MGIKHKVSQDGDIATVVSKDTAVTPDGTVVIKTNNGWFSPSGKKYNDAD